MGVRDGCSGFSNPGSVWSPECLPFRGEYNDDNGTIDLPRKPPPHWGLTSELLSEQNLTWMDDRYDKERKPLPVVFDYEDFFSLIERGWVRGKGIRGYALPNNDYPVGQMLIREDVWNYMLGVTFDPGYGVFQRAKEHEHVRTLVNYVLKEKETSKLDLAFAFKLERDFQAMITERSSFVSGIFGRSEIGASIPLYRIKIIHGLCMGTIDPETALGLFYEIADLAHVNEVMGGLRRAWGPQPGKGSQEIDWPLHMAFAKEVARIAKYEDEDEG